MARFRLFFALAAFLCAALPSFSAAAAEGAAREGKELFAFYLKAKIPGGWSSSSNFGYFWLSESPDESCAVMATLKRYEAPDEALLVLHDDIATYREADRGPGYFFINDDSRGWFSLSGETAFWLETRGQCPELSGILSSVEITRDATELEALRKGFTDSPNSSPYWGKDEMPDLSAIARALASQNIRDWLAFVTPAPLKGMDSAEEREDESLETREYTGITFEALIPERWTVTERDGGVTFSSPDGKRSVTATVREIADQSDAGVLAFAREYRQSLGGKNMIRSREDRAGMENRYSFTLPGGAVVFVDGRTAPVRIVTYSNSELASIWENEMDCSLYVHIREQ
ncbi:hypothetical protein LJC59_04145 [Desulfovibrio sp. OttesenSCG-928-A18]|nr:hypothetical protein [Desulfovibrio sp. OttesenSCG-928-A18]